MKYEVYLLLHLVAFFSLFLVIGALLAGSGHRGQKRMVMVLHGLSTLTLLVTGFGLMARIGLHSFPPWILFKLGAWVVLSFILPILVSRKIPKIYLWIVAWGSGLCAVCAVIAKPFM